MAYILNFPLTLIGVLVAMLLFPVRLRLNKKPLALIFNVKKDSFGFGYLKGWRGMTIGHTVILNPRVEEKDLEHELIHVEQQIRHPFIQPLLYSIEIMHKGYRNNKYEVEAYDRSGSRYGAGKLVS
ncbi:MAG: hypothetical protein JWL88_337 [Parcubacteria group bacterium]|nr:hypothetical protein [Parcubacteria group bacterium]